MTELLQENIALIVVGGLVLACATLVVLLWRARRSGEDEPDVEPDLRVDVEALQHRQVPPQAAQLHFYNIPVRLAVVVIAPLGRYRRKPTNAELPSIVEGLLPHMMELLEAHQPEFRRWPPQVSKQGFAQAFFKNVRLPGNRGKGTPWCAIAGKFEAAGQMWLAGLACSAPEQNSLGQVVVEREGQWLDVLRVRIPG